MLFPLDLDSEHIYRDYIFHILVRSSKGSASEDSIFLGIKNKISEEYEWILDIDASAVKEETEYMMFFCVWGPKSMTSHLGIVTESKNSVYVTDFSRGLVTTKRWKKISLEKLIHSNHGKYMYYPESRKRIIDWLIKVCI